MSVGEQIRLIRKKRGLTQKQVADACGMADSAIRKYESGTIRPKIATVSRIANALGVDTTALTQNDPNYPISLTIYPPLPPEDYKEMITELYLTLSGTLSSNMRYFRAKLNISQDELSIKSGISLAEIQSYESDDQQCDITIANLKKISDVFNVNIDHLLGVSSSSDRIRKIIIEDFKHNLDDCFAKLNYDGQKKLTDYAKDLSEIPRYQAPQPPSTPPAPDPTPDTPEPEETAENGSEPKTDT